MMGEDPATTTQSLTRLLASLRQRASEPRSGLRETALGPFHHSGQPYSLPRFVFQGPSGGGDPLRLGIFAAVHGDEPEGASAACEFLSQVFEQPHLATGYELHVYPVCNPTGLEDGTRHSRSGLDLNREFWRNSEQPEVRWLERELGTLAFTGLISLHSDDTSAGVYAFVRGATLTEALAKPALAAAARFLPLASGEIIDGFAARGGLISDCYEGVLSNPAELQPAPFEIIFETPQHAPVSAQVQASVAALHAILHAYREFIAFGQNL